MSNKKETKLRFEGIELDNFFKTLMFQKIMDSDFTRNERDTLLVIFRKTIHFDKWKDGISMYSFSKSVGVSVSTLRATIKRLEAIGIIDYKKSSGGKTDSPKKYNTFSLSPYFVSSVYQKWETIKLDNDFDLF